MKLLHEVNSYNEHSDKYVHEVFLSIINSRITEKCSTLKGKIRSKLQRSPHPAA